jgi:hypothetical protein
MSVSELPEKRRVGLCTTCMHGQRIDHPRGGAGYWRCGRSSSNPDYPRFPRLPVVRCPGHEIHADQEDRGPAGPR